MNEPGFDLFTENKHFVLHMTHALTGKPVVYVAIGAMLVSCPTNETLTCQVALVSGVRTILFGCVAKLFRITTAMRPCVSIA